MEQQYEDYFEEQENIGGGLCAFAAVLDARERNTRAREVDYSREAVEGIFEIITEFYYWWKAKTILAGDKMPREFVLKARRHKRQKFSSIRRALEEDYEKIGHLAETWMTWRNNEALQMVTGKNLLRHIVRDQWEGQGDRFKGITLATTLLFADYQGQHLKVIIGGDDSKVKTNKRYLYVKDTHMTLLIPKRDYNQPDSILIWKEGWSVDMTRPDSSFSDLQALGVRKSKKDRKNEEHD